MENNKYTNPFTRTLFEKIKFSLNSPYAESVFSIAYRKIRAPLYLDLKNDVKSTVFMAGTGRSGTTWLTTVLNYDNSYRYIHEPFHPMRVKEINHIINGQYLKEDNLDEKYYKPFKDIIEGRIRGSWVDRYNRKFFPKKRLIKAVRANMVVSWLHTNFPDLPIIFTMRHPLAVTNSKMTRNWPPRYEMYLEQQDLIDDYLLPFIDEIRSAKTDFEKHIFSWCIENYVPLKQLRKSDVHFLFYEQMFSNPDGEVKRLFGYLEMDYTDKVFENVRKPSPTSRKDSAVMEGKDALSGWKGKFDEREIKRAVEILEVFGLDKIYCEKREPQISLDSIDDDSFLI